MSLPLEERREGVLSLIQNELANLKRFSTSSPVGAVHPLDFNAGMLGSSWDGSATFPPPTAAGPRTDLDANPKDYMVS